MYIIWSILFNNEINMNLPIKLQVGDRIITVNCDNNVIKLEVWNWFVVFSKSEAIIFWQIIRDKLYISPSSLDFTTNVFQFLNNYEAQRNILIDQSSITFKGWTLDNDITIKFLSWNTNEDISSLNKLAMTMIELSENIKWDISRRDRDLQYSILRSKTKEEITLYNCTYLDEHNLWVSIYSNNFINHRFSLSNKDIKKLIKSIDIITKKMWWDITPADVDSIIESLFGGKITNIDLWFNNKVEFLPEKVIFSHEDKPYIIIDWYFMLKTFGAMLSSLL